MRFTHHAPRSTYYGLLIIVLFGLIVAPLAAAGIPDRRFGAIDTFDDPKAASALGAGWTRVRFPWADLQPNNDGEWNDAFFTEAQLNAELAAGREVVGLIVNTPSWALEDGSIPGVPRGLNTRDDDPNNTWAIFLRKIVSRYAGRIDHWIIWNEPDIWDPRYPGRTWGSDEKDFYQLLRVAYNVIKATNPNATVHLGAFTYFWDTNYGRTPFFSRLLDLMAKDRSAPDHNYYFDVASANLYFRTDTIYDLIAWHHQQMRERGFDKPLWLTETNAAPSTDPAWPVAEPEFTITLDEQSHFIIQSFAIALAAGTQRIAIYKMADVPGDHAANPEPFGLVREDGSRRPAFAAFQVAANYLAGFTAATLDQRGDYAQVTVQRGEAWTTVAWTRQPSPVNIEVVAHTAQATLVDATGRTQRISAKNGKYIIELAGASCTGGCLIGGAPRLIVEGASPVSIAPVGKPPAAPPAVAPPAVAASPIGTAAPDEAATPSSVITPTVTLTKAPTRTPTRTPTLTATSTHAAARTPTPTATATSTATVTATPTSTTTSTPSATPTVAVTRSVRADDPTSDPAALIAVLTLGVVGLAVIALRVKGRA
ncbi:MAG: hypothetical protein HY870_10680 [Chloroflexi bacterium]|nr:hypothetical protein [Chloroflexota bacterium]